MEYHLGDYQRVFRKLRDFLRVEANAVLPGPTELMYQYENFQGWLIEKKISDGHTEQEALKLPTQERLDEMSIWIDLGMPTQ